ncbi:very short patch repair endonuclease [Mycobacterium colombiense]|uniref:Very short patch repair endonuclease n=1 Tax=Mycobacterium colombiense TaxID=339268 RepID=A0A329KI04_9MYCO|nr:very short patch repair endonuclease [Mycobacterium colombiense]RAU93511.1 very short patch repair endonuclease [Mycobacterium colombiense]
MPSLDRHVQSRRPAPLNEHVRRQMQTMPRKDTGAELELRRQLHRLGLRFQVNVRSLPGCPDIVFTRAKLAIFVDGCFWHRCPDHGTSPKNNRAWWAAKLDENVARDRRKDDQLREMGWAAVHIWEHEDAVTAAATIRTLWQYSTGRSASSSPFAEPI